MFDNLKGRHIILASKSPRRRYLLSQLGLEFSEMAADIDESFPDSLTPDEAALYLAEKKADHFADMISQPANIIITADTLVLLDGNILGKPEGKAGAKAMLKALSGRMHQVVTGICIRDSKKNRSFTCWTDVYFKELSDEEITYYLEAYQPYDKAGSYGIQEWIGYIGISGINGSYFNVMGLPVHQLYDELRRF
ncbi:MAG TPA: Maf family protein [Bacteroidales bacterium]|nr:septum formation protein Maf [Bacteroidales bacterium]HOX78354.1 Maf family protein [Bacteroidales bacterium]HPI85076.1 Maf family protein [Bacteroidales bacterium]HPM93652.1 Maf family protein [Bacteroidales bacterium]